MAASRPPFQAAFEHRPVERLGVLAERGGAVVALLAGVVAFTTGSVLLATTTGAGVGQLVAVATAPASTLSGLALVFHWASVGVAVGGWFLGLGFIVTGFLD
ncbi:hypothetical protein [Haloarchaeobius sp. TZWSO28]|uniref:hypothetical protein n=1 Tax=Haloarchaeobius sp. TZWSO28 TaxID=3446119 RepID=UPI003EBDB9A2